MTLNVPYRNTELGKTAFTYYGPHKWNSLQVTLQLDTFLSLEQFKLLLNGVLFNECSCFSLCICFVCVYFYFIFEIVFYSVFIIF